MVADVHRTLVYGGMHVKIISQSALHPTRKREDEILEKKYEKRPYKYKNKTKIAVIKLHILKYIFSIYTLSILFVIL
jgi:hypothetical protein